MANTIKRLQKRIRDADGRFRILVSYDGTTWHLDDKKAQRRITAASNLHGKTFMEKIDAEWDRIMGTVTKAVPDPVLLPVTTHGSPILGKAKGKNQKYRRNLRVRKEREVQQRQYVPGAHGIGMVPKGVHKHRCHNRFFMCSCEFPWLKRKCGNTICLHEKGGLLNEKEKS